MGQQFDPYHTWLGIPPEDQPPHHYRLLGLEPLEHDREVIVNAVNQRISHVKSKLTGPHGDEAKEVLARITAARICLLTPEKKNDYDSALQHAVAHAAAMPPGTTAKIGPTHQPGAARKADGGPAAGSAKSRIKTAAPLPTAKPLEAAKPVPQKKKPEPQAAAPAASSPEPARQPRFKGSPDEAAPAAAPAPTAAPAPAPTSAPGTGPQIFAEKDPRVWRRKKSRAMPLVILLVLVVAAGAVIAVAFQQGHLRFGTPEVAANSADDNTNGDSTDPDPDLSSEEPSVGDADDQPTTDSGAEGNGPEEDPAAELTDEPPADIATSDPSGTGDASHGGSPTDAPKDLGELTDEPWAGLFPDAPGAGEEAPGDDPADQVDVTATDTSQTDGEPTSPPGRTVQLWPVPSRAEQDKARATVKGIFRDEIAAARTPNARVQLAQKLFAYADQAKGDSVARYTLLTLTRDLAAGGGETLLMLDAVNLLAKEYEVDSLKMKGDAFQLAGESVSTAPAFDGVLSGARSVLAEAERQSRYEIAVDLADALHKAARPMHSSELNSQCLSLLRDINARKARYDLAQRARATLQETPADPEANLALGKYLVLTKADFKSGLAHLAKGSDPWLAEVAKRELSDLSDPQAKIELAGLWQKRAAAKRGEAEEDIYRRRAVYWLRKSLPQLNGLDKIATAEKLKEMGVAVDLQGTAAPPPEDKPPTPQPSGDGTVSDADLLDSVGDVTPPETSTKNGSTAQTDKPDAHETPAPEPAAKPAEVPGKTVEDFFGPRPARPKEDDDAGNFFGQGIDN